MNKLKYLIAGATIAGVVLAFSILLKAGDEIHRHTGPIKIHLAKNGHAWVLSHGQLHEFDRAGARLRVLDLARFGLPNGSTEFFVLADDRLLIAEPETPAIHRCDIESGQCANLTAASSNEIGSFDQALWLAVDETAGRVFVSDSGNHRLLMLDMNGRLLDKTESGRGRFFYPNHIDLMDAGRIVVTDTNHRRIVEIGVAGDRLGADGREMSTRTERVRSGRRWPVASAGMPDGKRWVIVLREGMSHGDVILFDADGKATKRLDLGEDADPMSLAVLDDRVLIADRDGFRVRQVAMDGGNLADFGGADFQRELAGHRDHIETWLGYQLASQIGMGAIPLLGIALLWLAGERPPRRTADTLRFDQPEQAVSGDRWLRVRPEFVRMQKRGLAFIVAVTGLILLAYWSVPELNDVPYPLRNLFMAMSALVVLTTAFALAVVTRMMKMRLGTNGTVILFDRGDGVARQFPLREVKSDGNHLLLGKSMVPMKTRRLALFDPADLESLILSRVPAAGRVSSTKLFLASLKAGNAAHWFTVGLFVLIVAVQLLETFRPDLYRDILLIWHDSQPRG